MFDVTLTFDNGPDAAVTPAVLDVLAQRDIRATFFVLGHKLADPQLRDLAARAHDAGHWIGNHTFTHSVPLGRQVGPVADHEIGDTEALIGALAHPDKLFRPYGGGGALNDGLLKPSVVGYLTEHRYTCVLWNAVPGDWCDPDGWVDVALADCPTRPWTVLVLHDLPTGAMAHLDRFIGRISDMGGRFRQEFPSACVPIVRGDIVLPIDTYVSDLA